MDSALQLSASEPLTRTQLQLSRQHVSRSSSHCTGNMAAAATAAVPSTHTPLRRAAPEARATCAQPRQASAGCCVPAVPSWLVHAAAPHTHPHTPFRSHQILRTFPIILLSGLIAPCGSIPLSSLSHPLPAGLATPCLCGFLSLERHSPLLSCLPPENHTPYPPPE